MFSKFFINRPIFATVLALLIVVAGLVTLNILPVAQFPEITPPTVQVSAVYPGANAETVAQTVGIPIEQQVNGVDGMLYMSSNSSSSGAYSLTITFAVGTDIDMATVQVQNRVSIAQSSLPEPVVVQGVTVQKQSSNIVMFLTMTSQDSVYNSLYLTNYAKLNLVDQLTRVPGVGAVNVMGAGDYSMRIWLDPEAMRIRNISPQQVYQSIQSQNVEVSAGYIGQPIGQDNNNAFQYTLNVQGRLKSPEQFGDIIIRREQNGAMLRLKDIARIDLGSASYSVVSRLNGKPTAAIAIYQQPGSNSLDVSKGVKAKMEELAASFPKGVSYNVTLDTTDVIHASIDEVMVTFFETTLLVILVIFLFLQNWRAVIIPCITIPVSLIGTFAVMAAFGFSINTLTLFGLILAVAIVVDDAIVVVEAVHAKLDEGYQSARQASIDAMGEIGGAIISITLVMMLVFIPVSFMPGTSGVFYRQFGLTMAIAIGFSAINALTLSPALCALFLKPHNADGSVKKMSFVEKFHKGFNAGYETLLGKYNKVVNMLIKAKAIVAVVVIAAIGVLMYLMSTTANSLVPNEDTGTIMGVVSMPPGTSLERTSEVLEKVDVMLNQVPEIKLRTVIEGYSFIADAGNTYGSIIIKLKDWDERKGEGQDVNSVIKRLYGMTAMGIKDGTILFFAPPMISGYSMTNGIELQLQDKTGGDLNKFFQIEMQFLQALNQRPEIQMAYSSFNPTYPQYLIDVDASKASKAGIGTSGVLSVMQGYLGGMYVSNFNRFGKLYRVMMQASPDSRTSLESLKGIKVRTKSGMAPITDFVTVKRVYGPDLINRFNLYTSIAVNATANAGYSSGEAIAAVREVASQTLPQGYGYEFSGLTREEAEQSSSSTSIIFALCLLFVYLILSAQYESYILPLAVILSIPFGLMGTFIFARMFGIDNNIYLKIALIMLIGLLAKNAILIVEFALDRRKTGMSIIGAAVQGASARLRPILMTSLAMIIGLLPMMFASGVGANGNQALGTGSIGGMLVGMILQVLFVPCLFVIFQSIQEKFSPMKWKDTDNSKMRNEIEQYSI